MADACTHLDTIAGVAPDSESGADWFWCYRDEVGFELPGHGSSPSHP